MKYLFLISLVIVSGCKRKGEYAATYDGSGILEVKSISMKPVAGVNNTPTAGSFAESLGYSPDDAGASLTESTFNFFGLGQQSNARIRVGARVCVSSSYGRAENAVICGKAVLCRSMTGDVQRNIAWAANEVCVQSDCLPKNMNGNAYVGLDLPGTNGNDNCSDQTGRSTLFSLTRYYSDTAKYAFGRRGTTGFGLDTTNSDLTLDRTYGNTSAEEGTSSFALGQDNEKIYEGRTYATTYKGPATLGNPVTTFQLMGDGGGFGVVYNEGGFGASDASPSSSGGDGGESDTALTSHNGPSSKSLGLVQTRRGNVFQLSDEGGGGGGAEGTAKVFVH